jgi:lactoylglutathione lyase
LHKGKGSGVRWRACLEILRAHAHGYIREFVVFQDSRYQVRMQVEKLKYIIWAQDMKRAVDFYTQTFDAEVTRQSDVMAELMVCGSFIGVHSGGEGKRTWTGMSFQVADLFGGCEAVKAAGGTVLKEPEDTLEEPAHLAMCTDSENNEIMLTKKRG